VPKFLVWLSCKTKKAQACKAERYFFVGRPVVVSTELILESVSNVFSWLSSKTKKAQACLAQRYFFLGRPFVGSMELIFFIYKSHCL